MIVPVPDLEKLLLSEARLPWHQDDVPPASPHSLPRWSFLFNNPTVS